MTACIGLGCVTEVAYYLLLHFQLQARLKCINPVFCILFVFKPGTVTVGIKIRKKKNYKLQYYKVKSLVKITSSMNRILPLI